MAAIALILISAFFFPGIIGRTKSLTSGRKGPSLVQPMRDIQRLFRKASVYSRTATWIFRAGPPVYFAAVLLSAAMLPMGTFPGLISFDGDIVLFAYMMALGRFFMILGAMDTGSSFEGMGSSREALYSMLSEPAFFVLMGSFSLLTGQTSFYDIYSRLYFDSTLSVFTAILASWVIVQLAMIENSRMPYDDPKTHLELTMIHEVMILDYSGFDLALIHIVSAIKFAIFGNLLANLFITPAMPVWLAVLLYLSVQIVFAIAVGVLESFRARHKMRFNNQAVFALVPVAILVFISVIILLNR